MWVEWRLTDLSDCCNSSAGRTDDTNAQDIKKIEVVKIDESKQDTPVDEPAAQPAVEKPKEEAKPEETPEKKPTEMIDKANEAAARLERANVEHAKLIQKQEALQVEKTLGGKAEAGQPPKEETPEEYAKKVMAGEVDESKAK